MTRQAKIAELEAGIKVASRELASMRKKEAANVAINLSTTLADVTEQYLLYLAQTIWANLNVGNPKLEVFTESGASVVHTVVDNPETTRRLDIRITWDQKKLTVYYGIGGSISRSNEIWEGMLSKTSTAMIGKLATFVANYIRLR